MADKVWRKHRLNNMFLGLLQSHWTLEQAYYRCTTVLAQSVHVYRLQIYSKTLPVKFLMYLNASVGDPNTFRPTFNFDRFICSPPVHKMVRKK